MLRALSRLYLRYYNDGEIVTVNSPKITFSSLENAWGFLHRLCFDHPYECLKKISRKVQELAHGWDEKTTETILEELADMCIEYAQTRPLVPFDGDMLDCRYAEHCEEVCNLYDEEDDDD